MIETYEVAMSGIGIIVLKSANDEYRVIDVKKINGFYFNGVHTVLKVRRRDRSREIYSLHIDHPIDMFVARFKQALKNCN
jgi:hypothetical protein